MLEMETTSDEKSKTAIFGLFKETWYVLIGSKNIWGVLQCIGFVVKRHVANNFFRC